MLRVRGYSITKKLISMNMLVSGTALLLACVAFGAYDLITFRQAMAHNLSIQAQMAGSNSVSPLLFNDPQAAENTLSALKAAPNVASAGIYTLDGRPFATYSRDGNGQTATLPQIAANETETHAFSDGQLVLVRRIVFEGKPMGTVYIRSDLREMSARVKLYAGIAIIVLLVSLVAALLVASIFQRTVTEPIVHLAEVARIVSHDKNYAMRATSTGKHDEPDILIGAFNEMLGQIQRREEALQEVHAELEKRVEERTAQLVAANADLAATNRELEAFTYSVSHDLRAPLRQMNGFSRILAEEFGPQLPEEGQRYLNRIREGALNMGRLIDDLLEFARIGRKELTLQPSGMAAVVNTVLEDLRTESEGREVEWRTGELPFVECDAQLMKQVFANLLSNALKYTRPRRPAVIEVGCLNKDGMQVFFVRDNGVGFSMRHADKLFGVFQRLHRQEDFEGTGIGLATVQRIIYKHGGKVWAEAEIDKGATFYFTLERTDALSQQSKGAVA